jgi:hypothetical protein
MSHFKILMVRVQHNFFGRSTHKIYLLRTYLCLPVKSCLSPLLPQSSSLIIRNIFSELIMLVLHPAPGPFYRLYTLVGTCPITSFSWLIGKMYFFKKSQLGHITY